MNHESLRLPLARRRTAAFSSGPHRGLTGAHLTDGGVEVKLKKNMSGLLKLLYWAFLAYLVYAVLRFFRSLGRAFRPNPRPRPKIEAGVMVKDEECGTYLPREDALREIKDGKEFFFCSQECRRKFLEKRKAGERPSSPAS